MTKIEEEKSRKMSLHFGKRIRQERQHRHLSQEALAEALGISPRSIRRWEQGQVMPQASIRLQISRFFGLHPDEFFPQREKQFTPDHLWNVPFPRNPFFVGREEILQHLYDQLGQEHAPFLTQSLVLSGLGGIGKTQIALEYAYRYRQDYHFIFWLAAETTESVMTSLQSIADLLQLPERQATEQPLMVAAVRQWLATHRKWLLIGDNVENPDLLQMVLPPLHQGVLLFTTRRQTLGSLAEPLELSPLSCEEGVALILRRTRQFTTSSPGAHTSSVAAELVTLLEGLPLALDQAGAYIEETGCSIADYLQRYRLQRQQVLARRGTHNGVHPASVTITLRFSVEQVEQEHAAAADLLRVCAFLHSEAIPEELFAAGAAHLGPVLCSVVTNPYQFDIALAALRNASLVTRHPETRTLSVHRLVQAVLQDQMEPAEMRLWSTRVVRMINAVFPEPQLTTWARCEQFLAQALACVALREAAKEALAEAYELFYKAGSYLLERGRYKEAEPLLVPIAAVKELPPGSNHLMLIQLLQKRAELLWQQGQYPSAEQLLHQVLAMSEMHLGPEHPEVAEALNNMAILFCHQDKYEQAEPLLQRALLINQQQAEPKRSEMALTLNNLATLYRYQGKYEQAESLFQQVLSIYEREVGPAHPDTALPLNNLATLYRHLGKYEQAEQFYQRALAIYERLMGSEHPETALMLNNLALVYQHQGKYEQAEALFQQALHIREQQIGAEHPKTLHTLSSLATLYQEQRKYEQAEPLLRRLLAIQRQQDGRNHPELAETLDALATCQEALGKEKRRSR